MGYFYRTAAVLTAAALLGVGLISAADAQSTGAGALKHAAAEFDRIQLRCIEASIASIVASCIASEEKRAGDQLSRAYQRRMQRLAPSAQALLRSAQRGWLQYQENQCKLAAETALSDGPGFGALAQARCLLRTTLVRLGELEPARSDADPFVSAQAGQIGFRTPSDNIHCMVEEYTEQTGKRQVALRFDISETSTRPPPKPSWCDADWGQSFSITVDGAIGERLCASDTVRNDNWPILAYGTVWQQKGFTCTSEPSGLTCANSMRNGFSLARASQRLF